MQHGYFVAEVFILTTVLALKLADTKLAEGILDTDSPFHATPIRWVLKPYHPDTLGSQAIPPRYARFSNHTTTIHWVLKPYHSDMLGSQTLSLRYAGFSNHTTPIRWGYGTQDILLYYDTPGQWDSVYKRGKTCSQQMSVLSIDSNQVVSLNSSRSLTSTFSGCRLISYSGDTWYNCAGTRKFKSSRERWWYIAVARCGPPKDQVTGLYLEYRIHMTNGDNLFHEEFSVDEFYILPIDIVFLCLYLIICTLSVIFATKLKRRQLLHTTYKLYLVAVFIWTAHLVVMVAAWARYGHTGVEIAKVEVTGRILQRASTTVLVLMLILLGKGFTIARGRLPGATVVKLCVFILFYALAIVALFIWEGKFFDAGKVLYYYESPPGYGLLATHLIGWIWFLQSTIFTLKHAQKKANFYIPFFTFYTVWFWAGPLVILIAMFSMAKWSRQKTVNGVEQFITFLGHCFFLILTRPNAANSNFPYHIRTSQISTYMAGSSRESGNPYVTDSSFELFEKVKTDNSGGNKTGSKLSATETDVTLSTGPSPLYPALFQRTPMATVSSTNFLRPETGDVNRDKSTNPNLRTSGNSNSNISVNNTTNDITNTIHTPNNNNNNNNNNSINANHLFSQSISVMTRRGETSTNPLPSVGEARALPPHLDKTDPAVMTLSEHPLSPSGATAWQPRGKLQLPPLRNPHNFTRNSTSGFSDGEPPSALDYNIFQAKQ
ncbi:transmembrane protein 145 [Plakobranchus ocellatus]|uniref:Transmembrane protein 145 n=1 Tax=Plakobranchus ocellatus TaxID=259542 RepID=A0AAV3ZXS8_9GAST|nr:transmembrane protein 145 [Plakobranchus ocellatus]